MIYHYNNGCSHYIVQHQFIFNEQKVQKIIINLKQKSFHIINVLFLI